MSKTLLNGVNEVLKKAKLIQGDSGALTSLTDSARQVWVDTIIQAWNEILIELYHASGRMLPKFVTSESITLVTDDRDYAVTGDTWFWPLLDETNGRYISEYRGGFEQMIRDQPVPANFTGLPLFGVVEPESGELYLDRIPTSSENGLVYKVWYQEDGEMSTAAAEFPFSDSAFIALVPAAYEKFRFHDRPEIDAEAIRRSDEAFRRSMAQGGALLTKTPARRSYGPGRVTHDQLSGIAFPFEN